MTQSSKSRYGIGFATGIAVILACGHETHTSTSVDASIADTPQVDAPHVDPVPADKLHVRTADTDADQLDAGQFSTSGLVVAGPFVLTDIQFSSVLNDISNSIELYASPGSTCGGIDTAAWLFAAARATPIHGARYLVKSGFVLCSIGEGIRVSWAGYHPYAAP